MSAANQKRKAPLDAGLVAEGGSGPTTYIQRMLTTTDADSAIRKRHKDGIKLAQDDKNFTIAKSDPSMKVFTVKSSKPGAAPHSVLVGTRAGDGAIAQGKVHPPGGGGSSLLTYLPTCTTVDFPAMQNGMDPDCRSCREYLKTRTRTCKHTVFFVPEASDATPPPKPTNEATLFAGEAVSCSCEDFCFAGFARSDSKHWHARFGCKHMMAVDFFRRRKAVERLASKRQKRAPSATPQAALLPKVPNKDAPVFCDEGAAPNGSASTLAAQPLRPSQDPGYETSSTAPGTFESRHSQDGSSQNIGQHQSYTPEKKQKPQNKLPVDQRRLFKGIGTSGYKPPAAKPRQILQSQSQSQPQSSPAYPEVLDDNADGTTNSSPESRRASKETYKRAHSEKNQGLALPAAAAVVGHNAAATAASRVADWVRGAVEEALAQERQQAEAAAETKAAEKAKEQTRALEEAVAKERVKFEEQTRAKVDTAREEERQHAKDVAAKKADEHDRNLKAAVARERLKAGIKATVKAEALQLRALLPHSGPPIRLSSTGDDVQFGRSKENKIDDVLVSRKQCVVSAAIG